MSAFEIPEWAAKLRRAIADDEIELASREASRLVDATTALLGPDWLNDLGPVD